VRWTLLVACAVAVGLGCRREEREFQVAPPPPSPAGDAIVSGLRPGGTPPAPPPPSNPFAGEANALSQGRQLYEAYNCVGCHAHGGGGMGPPLMDDQWIYGGEPANVFSSIVEGRPNGMPAFRGKIPDDQVWQLVAYVRSLSGLQAKDVAPQRPDHMSARTSEQQTERQPPRGAFVPPAAEGRVP
jgi:cytochrome c oxidase cbb3-type subunit 3